MPTRSTSLPISAAPAVLAALLSSLAVAPAGATGFLLFQHGGRATGQAGAFVARAADPSAVTYNPAALVHLEGLQLQAGIDFTVPNDEYDSASGHVATDHEINFPPSAYLSWKPSRDGRWAFGLGIDEPMWDNVNWEPKQFAGRFLTRREEHRISELHLESAFDLGGGWSVGLGARYAFGKLEDGRNALLALPGPAGATEVEMLNSANVNGTGADASVQWKTDVWGFGAKLRSPLEVSGNSTTTFTARPGILPALPPGQGSLLDTSDRKLSFEMPLQADAGVWFAPYPELRVEIDAALAQWSSTDNRSVFFPGGVAAEHLTVRDRDWKDTLAVRLGVEGDLTDALTVYGGIALEPSPVPARTLEPGFARGDATVYAVGASYSFPTISFDLGWSMHQMQSRGASGQELRNPAVDGRYRSNDQAFGFAVRWRFGS